MPVTPFHFGAGLAAKGAAPQRFGFFAFCAANVFMDLEPLYYMLARQFPLHRFFHTFVGSALIGLLTVLLFSSLGWVDQKLRLNLNRLKGEFHAPAVWWGALSGAFSHVLLDSLVHADVHPFAPFIQINPFVGFLSPYFVENLLIFMGFLGLVLLGLRFILRSRSIW